MGEGGAGVENLDILIWSKEAIYYNGISPVLGIIRKYGINYDEISFRLKLPDFIYLFIGAISIFYRKYWSHLRCSIAL